MSDAAKVKDRVAGIYLTIGMLGGGALAQGVEFDGEFAPTAPVHSIAEQAHRDAVSLNGRWEFQAQAVPENFVPGSGIPPKLQDPAPGAWEKTPIKIPSPWNVNAWGSGRNVGKGTAHPYWPDSVYFPSYPEAWDTVKMAWMRRGFPCPELKDGRRVLLRFEAVAGDCEVRINGHVVALHFDSWLPFEADITPWLREENELLVGVRSHELFRKQSAIYPKMHSPFPTGSKTGKLVGIWQDVSLLVVPELRVAEVFVKPLVKAGVLELEVVVGNDGTQPATFSLGGGIRPWNNTADDKHPGEPSGNYGAEVIKLPVSNHDIPAGETTTLNLSVPVNGELREWNPESPNLHGIDLSLTTNGKTVDVSTTRFGWREFSINGKDLLLNGRKIQLTGDLLHPFGPFILSRPYVWAWYRMIRDLGGNAVRPHAQIHPRHFLDLADEVGLVVLDETSIFGSSIALNFEEPSAWKRFEQHVDGLVMRDRNHPSVLGWSFGNELFAIFHLNNVPEDQASVWYAKLAELGLRTRKVDPTRAWISCDGDQDLSGTLPVWSAHFGHGTPLDRIPDLDKPRMVGESGGSYYARPSQLAEFNGSRAYEDYAGRNEALAIDVYDNIVKMARPHLAYFSASETAWFGLEHLNFGYRDFTRLPDRNDGVRLTRPYQDGKPGIQPERIPPYVATLNPGWDKHLPLYKPLAMFDAQKAALAHPEPAESPWDHRTAESAKPPITPATTITQVEFAGDDSAPLARRLRELGLPLSSSKSSLVIIDGDAPDDDATNRIKQDGGTAIWVLGEKPAALPAGLVRTTRPATQLVPDTTHPWTRNLGTPDLYFAEDGANRHIMQHGIGGSFPDGASVLLKAGATDWSLFNEAPEFAKCAAVVLYEHLEKPSGAAMVEIPWGQGKLVVCSLDYRIRSKTADTMWRRLFTHMGVLLGEPADRGIEAFDRNDALVNALGLGRFGAPDLKAAIGSAFIDETTANPKSGGTAGGREWKPVTSPSRDRFQLAELGQTGPEDGAVSCYFSFRVQSPRALDDLLLAGPDAPKFRLHCYVSDLCKLFVNGKEFAATHTDDADYRKMMTFDGIPLKKGWNHLLLKVATDSLKGAESGTLAVRMGSSDSGFLSQLQTTIELKEGRD